MPSGGFGQDTSCATDVMETDEERTIAITEMIGDAATTYWKSRRQSD